MEDYGKHLVERLVAQRRLKRGRAAEVLAHAANEQVSPEEVLVANKLIDRAAILETKAAMFGVAAVDLDATPPDHAIVRVIPQAMAVRYHAICIGRHGDDGILVAMADPTDAFAKDYIQMRTGFSVESRVAYMGDIRKLQEEAYLGAVPAGTAPPAVRERVAQEVLRNRVLPATPRPPV